MLVEPVTGDIEWYTPSWRREFIVWPRRCSISNKLMWLTHAYCGKQCVLVDFGRTRLILKTWHNEDSHLLYLLTNQN